MTKSYNLKIAGNDNGLTEKLEYLGGIDERSIFVDLLGNPKENSNVWWDFKDTDDNDIKEFNRYELNNSGAGINSMVLKHTYFHTPPREIMEKYPELEQTGNSVHSVGEKVGYKNIGVDESGIEVLTKTEEDELWTHLIYRPRTKQYIKEPRLLSVDEAISEGLPLDVIGKQKGSWVRYYINVKSFNQSRKKNWFKVLEDTVNARFRKRLQTKYLQFKSTQTDKAGNILNEFESRPASYPSIQTPYHDIWENNSFEYKVGKGKPKVYQVKVGFRPTSKQPESKRFKEHLESRGLTSAIAGLEDFRDNSAVIVEDEKDGYVYFSRPLASSGYNSTNGKPMIRILVDKNDIKTDLTKNEAWIKDGDGDTHHKNTEGTKLNEWLNEEYPVDKSKEDQLRNRIYEVLTGERKINHLYYIQLCGVFGAPVEDHQWAKDNIMVEFPVKHKKVDFYIKKTNHILELKIGIPDGDKDYNQILAYEKLVSKQEGKVEKVSLLAVSNEMYPTSLTGGFEDKLISKFQTELNQDFDEEYSLVDLRFCGYEDILK
jgi:hypothetical protein